MLTATVGKQPEVEMVLVWWYPLVRCPPNYPGLSLSEGFALQQIL
jgi:hypothetical protein